MRRSLTFATLLVSWLFAVPGLLAAPQEPDKRDEKPEAAKPGARASTGLFPLSKQVSRY